MSSSYSPVASRITDKRTGNMRRKATDDGSSQRQIRHKMATKNKK